MSRSPKLLIKSELDPLWMKLDESINEPLGLSDQTFKQLAYAGCCPST